MSNSSTISRGWTGATLVPRAATVEGFVSDLADARGVHLRDLEPLTTIVVRTRNSCYRIVTGNGTSCIVQGGMFFPHPTPARIEGSGFGGTLLKVGWIGIGLRMEIFMNGQRIITSPVHDVTVELETSAAVH